jgi:hypothetical protein
MNPYTWKELIDFNSDALFADVSDFLRTYGSLGALALSVAKWHPDNFFRGESGFCGLCLMFDDHGECKFCPLRKLWKKNCYEEGSKYQEWLDQMKACCSADKRATLIYNDLVKLYKNEYKRCKKEGFIWA